MIAETLRLRIAVIAAVLLSATAWRTAMAGDKGIRGLHIPQGRRISFNHHITDGGGFQWDIQSYGSIGQGTNYAYSGGLYCQINGSNVRSNGQGWVNRVGDEIEIGPYSRGKLRIWRRIKVYKDQGLARWLDIFENPTSGAVTVPVTIYSNTNYNIQSMETSSGATSFGDRDWAFITRPSGGNSPPLLHVLCGKKSKLRPTVTIQNSQIYVRWNLVVPAGKTVILCYFESQDYSVDAHKKTMKDFRSYKVLRDLPSSVRRLIVNWRSGGFAGVDLDRRESADTVTVYADGPKYGRIANESYRIETFFGPITLAARDVVGMAASPQKGTVRFVLTDGQIVSAPVPDEDNKIILKIPTGGELKIPFSRISRWSYRISKERPDADEFDGPCVMLRTGDRLALDAEAMKLTFRTRHGVLALEAKTLLRIDMDNPGNAVHRVHFLNGSLLGGLIEPRRIAVRLKLAAACTLDREMISQFRFAAEETPRQDASLIVLTNGDEIYGVLDEKRLEVTSEFGVITVKPHNIKVMAFSRTHLGRAIMKLWDGSIIRGQLGSAALSVRMLPGPTLKINPVQLVSVVCLRSLPPDNIIADARRLIAQLGAESYKDRRDATEKLVKMEGIAPLLREHLKSSDPEVRQRLEEIIERTGSKKQSAPSPADVELMMMFDVGPQ